VVTVPTGLQVWDPATGTTVCALRGAAFAVAASGDRLAWADRRGELHLSSVSRCDDRTVTLAPGAQVLGGYLQGLARFSPDGASLACFVATPTPTLTLVDTTTLRSTDLAPFVTDNVTPAPIAWAPDGGRIYFTATFPGFDDRLETERIGGSAEVVRFGGVPALRSLEAVPATP